MEFWIGFAIGAIVAAIGAFVTSYGGRWHVVIPFDSESDALHMRDDLRAFTAHNLGIEVRRVR